ncbi:MAG: DUF983 domain-containing protein [Daejeonella sp.]
MPKTTSKIHAITAAKCPKCRRGSIFTGSMYGFNIQRTNEFCSHCKMRFEVEPGYFYAAMYVSYALMVAEGVALGVLTYLITNRLDLEYVWLYILTIIGGCILLAPVNYRYSRVFLLYWLSPKVKYNPLLDTNQKI